MNVKSNPPPVTPQNKQTQKQHIIIIIITAATTRAGQHMTTRTRQARNGLASSQWLGAGMQWWIGLQESNPGKGTQAKRDYKRGET